MIFIGNVLAGKNSSVPTATDLNNVRSIELADGIIDGFYLSKDISSPFTSTLPSTWDFDTILHALFKDNLLAGNVDFSADQITHLRVKRREKGKDQWITLHDRPISNNDELSFELFDRFARSGVGAGKEYEYAILPCQNSIEGNLNINTVISKFDGVFIMEKEMVLQALLNSKLSTQINHTTSLVSTLGRRYPVVVQNGMSDYISGTLTATFIDFNISDCSLDMDNAVEYREKVHSFLNNKKPKILKHEDGRIWMVMIVDSIPIDESEFFKLPVEQVNFTETGDVDNAYDLYYNNFIDVNLVGGEF